MTEVKTDSVTKVEYVIQRFHKDDSLWCDSYNHHESKRAKNYIDRAKHILPKEKYRFLRRIITDKVIE